MQSIIITIFLFLASVSFAQKEHQDALNTFNKLRKEKIGSVSFYYNSYFKHDDENSFMTSVYIGRSTTGVWLQLNMSYKGNEWASFNSAELLYGDNKISIPTNGGHSGYNWGCVDVRVDKKTLVFLREVAKVKNPKMRFTGKKTTERSLSANEINGIKEILIGYDYLVNDVGVEDSRMK